MAHVVYSVKNGQKFAGEATLVVVECYSCGMTYAIPQNLHESALKYHGDKANGWRLVCPVGHEWWYTGESALQRSEREAQEAREREQATRELLAHESRSHAATRGHLTRAKRRAHAGVCPVAGCKRHFADLERHMESKHPNLPL